jgi:hypothetical protein
MHVSRVAALLLRGVRRSRRPLAMAIVSLIVAGICVATDVSGVAMAAEQPTQPSSATSDSSGSSAATTVTHTSGSSTSPAAGSSSSGSSSNPSAPTAPKPASHTPVKAPVKVTAGSSPATSKAHAPITSSLVPAKAPAVLTISGTSAVADTNHDGRTSTGDVVTTTWKVINTGVDTVTALTVTTTRGTATCALTTLPAAASTTCTSKTTLTQTDEDAAKLTVTGTANGTVLATPTSSAPVAVSLALKVQRSLAISQTSALISDVDHNGRTSQGDHLQFIFSVKNTGTQTMHGLVIIDSHLTSAHVGITCSTTTLKPGQTVTCRSGSYTVSSFDARQGVVVNSGRARATTPAGVHIFSAISTARRAVQKPAPKLHPHVSLSMFVASVKDNDGDGKVTVGDTVTYGFVIHNNGDVSVSGLSLSDTKLNRLHIGYGCGSRSLAAGASTRCSSGAVKISSFDVKQKALVNSATVRGTSANGRTVSAFDRITLGLSGSLKSLVNADSISSLPRTGGTPTMPLTIGFWMVLVGFGLVVAGRRQGQGRVGAAPIHSDRQSWQLSSRAKR